MVVFSYPQLHTSEKHIYMQTMSIPTKIPEEFHAPCPCSYVSYSAQLKNGVYPNTTMALSHAFAKLGEGGG